MADSLTLREWLSLVCLPDTLTESCFGCVAFGLPGSVVPTAACYVAMWRLYMARWWGRRLSSRSAPTCGSYALSVIAYVSHLSIPFKVRKLTIGLISLSEIS